MPNNFEPLFAKNHRSGAVLVGTSFGFDLGAEIAKAHSIKFAVAFAHRSGWELISKQMEASSASSIELLIGRSFFLSEPELLLQLKALSLSDKRFKVRLADMRTTFHPKVWIFQHAKDSLAIVGSGNLSGGGLIRNVECSAATANAEEISALGDWFSFHWRVGQTLEDGLEAYRLQYDRLRKQREFLESACESSASMINASEAQKRKSRATTIAEEYWFSEAGQATIRTRHDGLEEMRQALGFPHFDFGGDQWKQFLKIQEFGWIRETHTDKTISEIEALRIALRASLSGDLSSLDRLLKITGIGRNIATKLLAMIDPDKFVVINAPVIAALESFNINTDNLETDHLNATSYSVFLGNITSLTDAAYALTLERASALDAFFYEYRGTKND